MTDNSNVSDQTQKLLNLNMCDTGMKTKRHQAAEAAINVYNLITKDKVKGLKEKLDRVKESTKELASSYKKTMEHERYLLSSGFQNLLVDFQ